MSWSGCEVDNGTTELMSVIGYFINDLKNGEEIVLYREVVLRSIIESQYQCQVLDASLVITISGQGCEADIRQINLIGKLYSPTYILIVSTLVSH